MSESQTDSQQAPLVEGEELAVALAKLADDKQAEDIRVFDVREVSNVTDFIVLCSGTSTPHLKAIRKHVSEMGSDLEGVQRNCIDGNIESQWLIIDFWEVMVHIFHPEKREHYALEDLWGDAKPVHWTDEDSEES